MGRLASAHQTAMIDWWGPIIFEYYAGTEGNGSTFIDSYDWFALSRFCGTQPCQLHILDDDGEEVPQGETRLFRGRYNRFGLNDDISSFYSKEGFETLGTLISRRGSYYI